MLESLSLSKVNFLRRGDITDSLRVVEVTDELC